MATKNTEGSASSPADHDALATALTEAVRGAVRFDEYSQVLYATDGSIYKARPAGVVFPKDTADVQAAVRTATEHDTPILPRGTGSSLAGQAVGPGCVVLDLSRHMDDILSVDPEAKLTTVQPGVVQDHLDTHLSQWGLKFAPDPASSNRATIGGSIGNNSTGAHSVRYGITDAYTEECNVVLADGSLIHTRDIVLDSPEWDAIVEQDTLEARIYETVRALVAENEAEIEERYPTLKRSVSGYNLHKAIRKEGGEQVINLSKLLVGSEGTLGVVVEATLSLVTKPEETALVLYSFDSLGDAMRAVPVALEYDAGAVELMDAEVFRLARESEEYAQYADAIPERAQAALMLEFDSECHDDFEAAIGATNERFLENGTAFDALEAYTEKAQADIWKLRKAAIPLLMSLQGDAKPYPFIEDATVPPEELAAYVEEFEQVLDNHGTSAAYFAHAGSGTLHIRPILSLKEEQGIETMHSIAEAVTDLVLARNGSFSGEHGDGLARTEFNPKMYGPQLWAAFQNLKTVFDPEWLLNPGKVVFRDEVTDMRHNLRYGANYSSIEPQTAQDFSDEGGFSHLVELCNGCGTCRQTETATMCPTWRASKEEIQTTRGRANLLRAAISGDLPEGEMHSEQFHEEVLDLCVGCKGCMRDCPTGVDMAKLKAEVKHQTHQEKGTSPRERLFADIDRFSKLGSALAPLSNWATELPGARTVMEKTLGIAKDRDLPHFERESFRDWYASRGPKVPEKDATHRVLLFPDTYMNYASPEIGKAAVRVLEAGGCHVKLPTETTATGRAAYSKGFLDKAKTQAQTNVRALAPQVTNGWSVVFVEPSDAVMFQDEYLDLLPDDEACTAVSRATYGVCEFVDRFQIDEQMTFSEPGESISYHGHCNQKALKRDHHAVGVLRRAGFDVDPLDSGCCGMAGSFGYEAEHYDLSKAIGRLLFEKVDESEASEVVAPGASCRTQLGEREGETRPSHPVEKLAAALAD